MKAWGRKDSGSAIVDFVLVAPLLIAVALAILQVILVMHVRTVLTSAAAEGARAAALAADPRAGERRARAIIDETIASDSVERIVVRRQMAGGATIMALDIEARLPLLGLLGPTVIHVRGHSLQEQV